MIHAKHRNRLPLPQPAVVHVRRSYAECRFGQMHIWTAYPSGGGFDERVPLVCLHHAGGSGRMFSPILRELGHDRSVYAPDLPGHGSSDAAGNRAQIADIAGAIGDFLDSLRLRQVDVFAYQVGTLIAADLAIARPQQVRRVMLWGVPSHNAQDRVTLLQNPEPLGSREDGSDVVDEWRRTFERRGPGVPANAVAEDFGDRLRAGAQGQKLLAAAADYRPLERFTLIRQPTLLLRLRDEFAEQAPRIRAALSQGTMLEVSDYGQGFLSAAPQRFAAIAREFYDR